MAGDVIENIVDAAVVCLSSRFWRASHQKFILERGQRGINKCTLPVICGRDGPEMASVGLKQHLIDRPCHTEHVRLLLSPSDASTDFSFLLFDSMDTNYTLSDCSFCVILGH